MEDTTLPLQRKTIVHVGVQWETPLHYWHDIRLPRVTSWSPTYLPNRLCIMLDWTIFCQTLC